MVEKAIAAISLLCICSTLGETEIWEKDMTNEVYIEASVEGLEAVHLECFEDKMRVKVDLEEKGFDGVVYTRGSFKMGKAPCFYDAQGHDGEELSLEWTFDQCKTEARSNNKKSNEIVVQQNDMLIFPGDMAFELICKGQEATIGLADPDPGAKPLPKSRRKPVTGQNGKVTFRPSSSSKKGTKVEL